jgi:hypothetical protein
MKSVVKLDNTEVVDACLVFMAVHALGRLAEFREELAKGFDEHYHDLALAHVLENNPQVVPSFNRLSQRYQKLIADSLSVDFQFSQFLQAENLPANLVVLKEKLQPHGEDGFAFFCFRIFTQTCGKLGTTSLNGSLFMNETEFQRFKPGLEALQQLRTLDAEEAYQAFLRFRGSKALSRFASKEHQALARILCLGAAFDYKGGDALCDAFDELKHPEQAALTRWLTSDGIHVRPGYILCHVPTLLHNAKANEGVGLKAAFEMMYKVQCMCESEVSSKVSKVVVHFTQVAEWAKDAPNSEEFTKAVLTLRTETHTSTQVFTVEVDRPDLGPGYESKRRAAASGDGWRWRCLYFLLLVCLLMAGAGLACEYLRPALADHLRERLEDRSGVHITQRNARYGLEGIAASCFFLLVCACCCRASTQAAPRPVGEIAGSAEPLLSSRGYVKLEQTEDPDNV